MLVCPRVQVNTVKGNSLRANSNGGDLRSDLAIEAVLVHTEVARRIAWSNKAWDEHCWRGSCHDIHFLVEFTRPISTEHLHV
jgi:hypothetical protein